MKRHTPMSLTIASRRREASIVYVQRTDGSGETWKIHIVTQRLGALKEDAASYLGHDGRAPACQERNQLNEEKAIKDTTKPTTPSEAERRDDSQTVT